MNLKKNSISLKTVLLFIIKHFRLKSLKFKIQKYYSYKITLSPKRAIKILTDYISNRINCVKRIYVTLFLLGGVIFDPLVGIFTFNFDCLSMMILVLSE